MNDARKCPGRVDDVIRLIDGELDDSARIAFESHLERCHRCRLEFVQRRAERAQWRDAMSLPSRPADRAKILRAGKDWLDGAPRWRRWLRARSWEDVVTGVSLAAIVILITILAQRPATPAWSSSSPARYYVNEQSETAGDEIPRPF